MGGRILYMFGVLLWGILWALCALVYIPFLWLGLFTDDWER